MNGNFGINVPWLFLPFMSATLVCLSSSRTFRVLVIRKGRFRGFLVIATFGVQSAKCIEGFTSNAGHDTIPFSAPHGGALLSAITSSPSN